MSAITYRYVCRICAAKGKVKEFTAPPLEGMLIDEKLDPRALTVQKNLIAHIEKSHSDEFTMSALHGLMMSGFLRMCFFDVPDPKVADHREWMRGQLAAMTRRVHIPDEQICTRVHALNLPDEYFGRVVEAIKIMRDIEEERGAFAVALAAADPPLVIC